MGIYSSPNRLPLGNGLRLKRPYSRCTGTQCIVAKDPRLCECFLPYQILKLNRQLSKARGSQQAVIKQTTLSFSSKRIEDSPDSDFGRRISRRFDWSKQDKSSSSTVSIAFDAMRLLDLRDIVRSTGASDRRRLGLQVEKRT